VRIEILADLHGPYWKPQANIDALISLGDVPNNVLEQARDSYCCPVFAVKGNHDSLTFPDGITDLHSKLYQLGTLTLGGFQGCWKYKPVGHFLYDQHEVDLSAFPKVDLFVAHNSPRGVHDREDGVHCGFDAFNAYIARVQPSLFLHGHQHANVSSKLGKTECRGFYGQQVITV
jgi:Icc-related predicted phosphoesterase